MMLTFRSWWSAPDLRAWRRRRTCWSAALEPLVLEAGKGAAARSRMAHVRLFSPWRELIDPAAARCSVHRLGSTADGFPTGAEWIEAYLAPLAAVLGHRVHVRRAGGRGVAARPRPVGERQAARVSLSWCMCPG